MTSCLQGSNLNAILFQGKLSEITDPSVYINPDQPLISKTVVSQDDVDKQEDKVKSTRARLAKALEALSG